MGVGFNAITAADTTIVTIVKRARILTDLAFLGYTWYHINIREGQINSASLVELRQHKGQPLFQKSTRLEGIPDEVQHLTHLFNNL